jgi:tetratricopeptide (TPR) repeat protein
MNEPAHAEVVASPPRAGLDRGAGVAGLLGLTVLFVASAVQKIWGLDTWWQLATGRWIVHHLAFPATDVFSYTAATHSWIEMRWLFCLLLYTGWQAGGPVLLIAGQVAALAGLWILLAWRVRHLITHPAILLILGLGIGAGLSRWVLRPELVAYVLSAVYLVWLDAARRDGSPGARRWVWTLVPLQVVWTSSSTLLALGPALAWAFAVGDAGQRAFGRIAQARRAGAERVNWEGVFDGRLFGVALAVTAACWINPYFHDGAMFPLLLLAQIQQGHIVSQVIGEMSSPLRMPWAEWTLDLRLALVLSIAVAGSFVLNRRRIDLPRLLIFAAALYLASSAQRNAGILAVWGTWAALRNAEEFIRAGTGSASWSVRWAAAACVALGLGWGGLAWYIATDRWAISIQAPRETGIGVVEWNTAREAADFLQTHRPLEPWFNSIRDGGYLVWRLQDAAGRGPRVFVDGRLEVYGAEVLAETVAATTPAGWAALERKYDFKTAIFPVRGHEDVVRMLAASDRWAVVFADHRNVVLVRRIPEHEALIAGTKDAVRLVRTRDAPPEHAPAWKRAIGGTGRPWWSLGMAETMLALGDFDRAAAYLALALERFPGQPRAVAMLAAVERFRGRQAEGDAFYNTLAGLDRWRVYSDTLLLSWLESSGRFQEAVPVAERVILLAPGDLRMRLVLADLYFRLNRFGEALPLYQAVIRRGTGNDPSVWLKLGYCAEQSGRVDDAIAAYRRSLDLDPSQAPVWSMLAALYEQKGDKETAIRAYRQALHLRPDSRRAREGLERLGTPP